MPDQLRFVTSAPVQQEVLEAYEVTYEFRREVQYRQDFERYCQWYQLIAERHRQELAKLRGDVNILGWFRRRH